MPKTIHLGQISVDVIQKYIENIHLSVYPPTGSVRISAPLRMDLDTIRVFAVSKIGWIKRQQKKLYEQEREPSREFLERESHYVWGKRYLLKMVESESPPKVELRHKELRMQVRSGGSMDQHRAIRDEWYRVLLKNAIGPLIQKWEPLLGVSASK